MSLIRVIPLGGIREEGKNMYVIEVNESIFILDCGLVYPEDEMLGIDAVIPDFSYIEENKDRVLGIFLTHGHEDAVGALSYLLKKVDAPVFGTELTIELATISAKNKGLQDRVENFFIIDEDTEIEFEDATISFFKTTHTIPDSVGIVLKTDEGSIVYTGDFKFDPNASPLYQTDFSRLTKIGDDQVLLLLSDSANAENQELNVNDLKIVEELESVFYNAEGRVIVACIGSNISRIQQVFDAAQRSQRRVFITGDNLIDIVDTSIQLGKIYLPSKDVIGQMKDLKKTDDDEIVVLETGDIGEPIKALEMMARHKHKQVNLKEGDLVYIATTPSISVETTLAKTKDLIYRAGAEVKTITDHYRVSGHASQNDLKLMLNFLKPQYLLPVNGESRMLAAHAKLAKELGYDDFHIFLPQNGDILEYKKGNISLAGQVPAGDVLVDGLGVGDIGNVVLRDRRVLSEDGIFIVVATISRRLKRVLVGPQISSRGFVYMKTSIDLIQMCSDMTLDVLEDHLARSDFDWGELKADLREKLGKFLFKETQRRPVVLPIIMEASSYQPKDE
ncbi:ribonuclease J [Ignavigranum ruoffiae]|uniref:Ribonuclease J n=1 Tax=Ignavigranum ruoffiae TaxID=89093 RepID=A0A1H8YXB8_9LACT|nr:ribonuclease J [Ignavigranum ruoffiae]SEP56824.1 ribonuclease J [Ignavigranum ruoffiae]